MESFDVVVISLPTGYVLYSLYHCYAAATYLGNFGTSKLYSSAL